MEPGREELAGAGWGKFSALGSIALRAQIRQQTGVGATGSLHSTLRSPAPPVGARTQSRDEKVEIGHGTISLMEVMMMQVCQCVPFIRG